MQKMNGVPDQQQHLDQLLILEEQIQKQKLLAEQGLLPGLGQGHPNLANQA